ncbi:hypothetical protein H0X06_01065 [Candidatus Dependentiae bacterium]|nr:hypothetical protein [Candidatus Dependentiae bacterium]
MNYNRIFTIHALFLASIMNYAPSVKAVLVNTWVVQLSKGNRCIFLFDIHAKTRDQRDVEQLKIVMQALIDREEATTRPLYILTESTLNEIRWTKRDVLCCLESEMTYLKIAEDKKFKYTSLENIDVRKLSAAITHILSSTNTESYDENLSLNYRFNNDFYEWRQGSLSFNDLLTEFNSQQNSALTTCKNMLELCDSIQETKNIEILYKSTIEETNRHFSKYSKFLQERNIELSSNTSIYKETYYLEKEVKENVRIILIECFSPFFDLYAFSRIFTLHKRNFSVDIVLIAGADHCWRILQEFGSTLQSEDVYSKTTELSTSECLPTEILYNVLQEKTPIEETPYPICLLF